MNHSIETNQEIRGSLPSTSLADLFRAFLRGRMVMGIAVAASLLLAILYLVVATPKYEVDLIVAPSPNAAQTELPGATGGSGVGAVVSSYLGIQSSGTPDFMQFLDALTSLEVATNMERKYHFLRQLNPALWDSKTQQWRHPFGPMVLVRGLLYGLMGVSGSTPPGPADLQAFLAKNITISSVGQDTDSRQISLVLPDRQLAYHILMADFQEANAIAKARALERSTIIIEYANKQLNDVSAVVGRDVLGNVVNQNIGQKLIASTPLPYAAQLRDQVRSPALPVSPNPLIVILLATIFGLLAGGAVAVVRYRAQ